MGFKLGLILIIACKLSPKYTTGNPYKFIHIVTIACGLFFIVLILFRKTKMRRILAKITKQLKAYRLIPLLIVCAFVVIYCLLITNGILIAYSNNFFILAVLVIVAGLIFTLKISDHRWVRYLISPLVYVVTSTFVASICFAVNHYPVRFATSVIHSYSEICISFSKNHTYRAQFNSIVGGEARYGKYTQNGRVITLDRSFTMGRFRVNNSMMIEDGYYLSNAFLSEEGEPIYGKIPMYNSCEDAGKGG